MNPTTSSRTHDPERVEVVMRARTRWRHEVAELGGANTLLWHRTSTTGTFDLNLAHPGGVAKLLSGRPTLLSELVREHVAFLDACRRLGAIRDKIEELRQEHGLETGFLAIGLATWQLHRVPVPPRAPVLLRACSITPVDAAHSDFSLVLHEDVVFNPVLEHYLRSEVHLELDPAMLAGLSAQSHGFDPRLTYQALEEICAEMTGFGIGPQMVVGTFPWAKLPLVTSYTSDPAPLAHHDVVAALAGADVSLTSPGPDPDRADDPAREMAALDADRSQRLLLDEVAHGAHVVLDTPAGTGATQTIANAVVAALSEGRTVLVCSEERAALDAVRRRLSHVGLGDLCLDLREDPASMRQVVADVRHALDQLPQEAEPEIPGDPTPQRSDALGVLRREQEVLHTEHQPWGLSLGRTEEDLATLAALEQPPASRVRLPLEVLRTLPEPELEAVSDALVEAAAGGAWGRGRNEDPWYAARLASADEAARAQEIVARLVGGQLSDARALAESVCREAGMPGPANLEQWGHRLGLIARASETLDVFTPAVYDAPLDEMVLATSTKEEVGAERPGAVARARLRRQVRSLLRPGTPPFDLPGRVRAARDERDEWETVAGRAARPAAPEGWEEALEAWTPIGEDLTWLGQVLEGTTTGHELWSVHLDVVLERLVRLETRADRAPVAASSHPLLHPLREKGMGDLVDDLARRGVPAERVDAEVRYVHRSSLLDHLRSDAMPQQVSAEAVREAELTFRRADRALLRINAARARRAVLRRLRRTLSAHPSQVQAWEAAVSRARVGTVDARDLFSRAPEVVLAAQPVLLASQLAVPAALPPDVAVDLVIVDRAGRTTAARTAPALVHGRQVLIVGDSGGPGPSAFRFVAEDRPDEVDGEVGRSLVQEASEVLPVRHLSTHYRALDQGLVAPLASVMPVPVHSFPGILTGPSVREHVVQPARAVGAGDEPGDQQAEPTGTPAEQAVAVAVAHARRTPEASVMLVTDDLATAEDVEIALRVALASEGDSAVAQVLGDSGEEPCLVRPAARVAGEVRDRVVWVTEGRAATDPRLAASVISGARRSLDLVVNRPVSEWRAGAGTDVVRGAVDFHGLPAQAPRSAVLTELVQRLRAEGLTVTEGVGHGPHAVDIAVLDPEVRGRYALAIDSDLEAPAAGPGRDDVRLRHDQLVRMGWTPVRVRRSDVFADPAREVARIVQVLRETAARRSS